ncbi:hypothetical protein F8M41_000599 [Gigaspora margarita]|uniref:Uncharacterized protein n=1 Tax=Gigaspora margarita TaxID=4874 RepID=A0A8H4AAT2_GIGMA|nr:hypothetical protein F8M41_000599 [Gigaspora margarita]
MPSQDCTSKSELDHMINRYLEALDNFIFELQKGQETKDGNKEYNRLPKLDLVLDLIDEYLVEESVVEVEKEDIKNRRMLVALRRMETRHLRIVKNPQKSELLMEPVSDFE